MAAKEAGIDFAPVETEAEQGMALLERMERRLARAGYVPVLHTNSEMRPEAPAGFCLTEYRRLDNPRHRALLSLHAEVSCPDDMIKVTFDKVSLEYPRGLKGLRARFRNRAEAARPVTVTARQLVEDYKTGHKLPHGEADADRYGVLAYTLQNTTGLQFFINPMQIGHDYVSLSARAELETSVRGRHKPSSLDDLKKYRRVFLTVPTAMNGEKNPLVYIKADNALSIRDHRPTTPQSVPMPQFLRDYRDIIWDHVRGRLHQACTSVPQFNRF